MTPKKFFLLIFGALLFAGCAQYRITTAGETEQAMALTVAQYAVPIPDGTFFGPADFGPVMEGAGKAAVSAMLTHQLTAEEQVAMGRFLALFQQVLGYQSSGPTMTLALTGAHKNVYREKTGTLYLSVHNGPDWGALSVVAHERTHPEIWARQKSPSLLNPVYWFRPFPETQYLEEVWAETALALFFQRLAAKSSWRPAAEERYFPLREGDGPELWAYFVAGVRNPTTIKMVEQELRGVRTYQELRAFCAQAKSPDYTRVWLCLMLLEARLGSPEAVWAWCHTADDEVLEAKIDKILAGTSADQALRAFVEGRKKLFQ